MKTTRNYLTLIIFLIIIANFSFAQTGPAGIGNSTGANGQPENVLWFDASSLSLANNDPVTSWSDISGNSNDAAQATGSLQPLYKTAVINGLPTVYFDGTDDYLTVPDAENLDNSTGVTVIVVGKPNSPDNNARGIVSKRVAASSETAYSLFTYTSSNLYFDASTQRINGTVSATGDAQIFSANFNGTIANPRSKVYNAGAVSGSGNGPTSIGNMASDLHIGIMNPAYGSGFRGDIAEVIIYRNSLNEAQMQIVHQYLNVKYGITITNDYYDPDAAYIYNVTGIGKESNGEHSNTSSAGINLTSLSGLDTDGEYVFTSHNNAANSSADFSVLDLPLGVENRYNRVWQVEKVGTLTARISFDFSEAVSDGKYPVNHTNYVLLYRAATTGAFSKVKNADGIANGDQVYFNLDDADLLNGYYTFATEDETNSPLQGADGRTWYTLISGDWDDWEVWTLDPSGAVPNNPDHYTPSGTVDASPTATADKVVILNGKKVTINEDGLQNAELTVNGRLDINTTTGHSFTFIKGSGRILLQGDNFPAGDATHFYTFGQGAGTVVYETNASLSTYDLDEARTFYNVEIDLYDASHSVVLKNDYEINNDLLVKNGIFQINDNSATTSLNITVDNDITIQTDGKILTGSADARHQFNIYGDLTNDGELKFTNRVAANYGADANDGIVDANFLNASENQQIYCNGISNFYRIEIDKGADKTYELYIVATHTDNFKLFGRADEGHIETDQLADNLNALGLIKGTVRIGTNVVIPYLNEGGNYNISENARLWVDGGTVQKTVSNAIVPYGEIKISAGLLEALGQSGITTRANGLITVEGGTANVNQIRTSVYGAEHVGGYNQSGGTVNVLGINTPADYYVFNLTHDNNVFIMSGGTLHVQRAFGKGGIFINSDPGNYNVTGGTVIMEIDNANDFIITSQAPFWDVILRKTGTGSQFILEDGIDVGATDEDLLNQPLVALNNLTIENPSHLNANGRDVKIGRNFDLNNGAAYTHGGNTTWFIEAGVSNIYARDNSTPSPLVFNNVEIAKDQRYNTSLFHAVRLGSTGRSTDPANINNTAITIEGNLKITRGEFDTYRYKVSHEGNIEIVDGRILANATNPGRIVLNGTALQTIKGSFTAEQEFGSFELDNSNGAKLLSNINVTNFELTTGVMDLDIYNLYVGGTLLTTGTYSASLMYQTAGNSSDGGIAFPVNQNDTYFFPIGTNANSNTRYTPATAVISNYSDNGTIQISVADEFLQTAITPGGNTYSYYWEVVADGFSAPPNVVYTFKLDDSDDEDNPVDGVIKNSWVAGEILNESPYERSDVDGSVNSPSDLYFTTNTRLLRDASYTAGKNSSFSGNLDVYYSYNTSPNTRRDWNNASYWTSVPHGPGQTKQGSGYPEAGDIAVIGYHTDNNRHQVQLNNHNAQCAKLIFEKSPTGSTPHLFIYQNVENVNLGKVEGFGHIYIDIDGVDDCDFQQTDFTAWVSNYTNKWQYTLENGNHTLPSYPYIFPTLRVAGQYYNGDGALGSFPRSAKFTNNITCYAMSVDSRALLYLNDGANGDINCYTEFRVGWNNPGKVVFPQSNSRTITAGSILVRSIDGSNRESDSEFIINENSTVEHHIYLSGDFNIENNDVSVGTPTIDFYANTGGGGVILELNGDINAAFSNDFNLSSVPDFYRIVMNKLEGKDFDFTDAFTLNGTTNSYPKALELISGDLLLQDADIDITLSSGGEDFRIPKETSLIARQDCDLRVSGDNTGIWLDGMMLVGWSSNWFINEGNNNYIEYTASGSSEIQVYQGDLFVGSQIRRSTMSEEGALNFQVQHTNNTIVIGTDGGNIPENNRGVLEILNGNSNLSMVDNSRIIIANAQDNPSFPTVYLNPETSSLGTGSYFQFGNADTDASQEMGLYSNINLKNISTDNTSTNNPKVIIWYQDIIVDEDITIDSNTELDADGWDITINGDWTNNGTYTPNENTTYFSGSATQELTGETEFYNFVKNTSNTLNVNDDITITKDFSLLDGTLNDNSNDISVLGNLFNDALHVYGGSGNGVYIVGTTQQKMESSGEWGKITINNPEGVLVETDPDEITVNDAVRLVNGVFDIGRNMLVMKEDAIFEEGNIFSETNMVRTFLSFTDNGIKKFFDGTYSGVYTFPIGSEDKYTPVIMDISSTGAGSIRVKASNKIHPTIQEDVETCDPNIVDQQNVLLYYWTLDAENSLSNFNADITMKYYAADAIYQAPYSLADYITAKLILGTTFWNKYDYASFDESNNLLHFTYSNADETSINGDYTAGVEKVCGGAIPDIIPTYISIADGDWTDETKWDTYPVPGGTVPTGGPYGAIAIVDAPHTITMNQNYILNYKTTINGILDVGTTFAQNIGFVDGTGELYVERGDIPAAVYDDFILENTGTFHYGGTDDYDVLSNLPIINNLKFSGTGERILPNMDIVLRGTLVIDGTDNTLEVLNDHNAKIEVRNNITFNSGLFDAGYVASAIFEIGGSNHQTIDGTGAFTGLNAFYHFVMDNPSGLTLEKPIEIDETLTFTEGIIYNDGTNYLTLNKTDENVVIGAGTNNYVDGTVGKKILNTGDFIFPVGNSGRYGQVEINNANQTSSPNYWYAEYFNANPLTGGMDPEDFDTPLQYVSNNEYWRINGPSGASSYVKLRWDSQSGASADDSERDDMRVAEWISANSQWEEAQPNGDFVSGTQTSGTITTAPNSVSIENNHYFTIATETITENTWQGDVAADRNNWFNSNNWSLGNVPTSTTNAIIPTNPSGGAYFPIIDGATTATTLNLTIETGASVTINAESSLTLTGNLDNDGTVNILSSNDSEPSGSFIDNGTITGTGTFNIQRYLTPNAFHYVSSPLQLGGNAGSALFTDAHSSGNFNANFYYYREGFDLDGVGTTAPNGGIFVVDSLVPGWDFAHGGSGSNTPMQPKIGYATWSDEGELIQFTGQPNTGNMSISNLTHTVNDVVSDNLTTNVPELYDGWNLVGNPYPSAIDWDLVKNDLVNLDEGIYVWDNGQYANYIGGFPGGSEKLSNVIMPMQAFFVHAKANSAGFTLNNSHRIHNDDDLNNYLKEEYKANREHFISLKIEANGYFDMMHVYFNDNATPDYDGRYDGLCLFSNVNQVPSLFSISESGTRYTINALPDSMMTDLELPLGVKVMTDGTYTIHFDNINGFDTSIVFIEDKLLNTLTKIQVGNSYTFSHIASIDEDRFVLHILQNNPPISNDYENLTALEDENFEFDLSNIFTDNDLFDNLNIEFTQIPEWIEIENQKISGVATNDEVGEHLIKMKAIDSYLASTEIEFLFTVINTNDAPIIVNQILDYEVYANDYLNIEIGNNVFTDIDQNDELTFSVNLLNSETLPDWLYFDEQSYIFIAAPTEENIGEYNIQYSATDLYDVTTSDNFKITVKEITDIEAIEKEEVSIYPNPFNDVIFVQVTEDNIGSEYILSDISGRIIKIGKINQEKIIIQTKNISNGAYSLQIGEDKLFILIKK